MKKVTIEIDDRYATILTVTAVGYSHHGLDVTTCAVDITKHNKVVIGYDGKAVVSHD